MPIGDLAEVEVKYDWAGQILENTYGFKGIAAGATLTNLLTALNTAGNRTLFLAGKCTSLTLDEFVAHDVVPGTGATVSDSTGLPVNGPNGNPAGALGVAVVTTLLTGLRGRSYRGRSFEFGYDRDAVALGVVSAGVHTIRQNLWTALLTQFGPTGTDPNWQLVVISRFLNGTSRPAPVGTPVVGVRINDFARSQRRRNVGIGS